MDDAKRLFEERLSAEYDLQARARLVILLSAVLYPSFLLLDAIYTPAVSSDSSWSSA